MREVRSRYGRGVAGRGPTSVEKTTVLGSNERSDGRPASAPVVFPKRQLVMVFEEIRSELWLMEVSSLNPAHRWYPDMLPADRRAGPRAA